MPIIATYHVDEIEFGQRVRLIKTCNSIFVEPDDNGDYEIAGVFPDERQVFVNKIMDDAINLEEWNERETTIRDSDWQDSGPTRHDITEDGSNEERLQVLADEKSGFEDDNEVSGLHMIKAYSLVFLPDETRVRLRLLKGYKLAVKDPDGEYIVTGSVKRKIRGADGYEIVVTPKDEHQRAFERKIGERYVTGRRSGICGPSRVDFISPEQLAEFKKKRNK